MTGSVLEWMHQEWRELHRSQEQSERLSLLIKLLAVVLVAAGAVLTVEAFTLMLLLLVLWLQESICRTQQGRALDRLLELERGIRNLDDTDVGAMQLYSAWQQVRPRGIDLLLEYLSYARRPTVAYPYLVLLGIILML